MLQLPSGWRCTVRALQGWMVEVIRQLCDILFWCLAVQAPCGPSPPHLLIPSWNTWGQTSSDEELVAVDHKKNIRAMSHKEKEGRWNKSGEYGSGKKECWEHFGEQRWKCERKMRAKDRIKKSRVKEWGKERWRKRKRDCALWAK